MAEPQARRAVVLSIGEELLDGRVLDRNAGWLAAQLRLLGVQVRGMRTIGDHPRELFELLQQLDGTVELIVSSGGLGPTADDRVRAEAALACGSELEDIPGAVDALDALWRRQHESDAPSFFLDQGRMPQGAHALPNSAGTALGFAVNLPRGTLLLCLPGPPLECQTTWNSEGQASVAARVGLHGGLAYRLFHTVSLPESAVEARVRDLLEQGGNPRYGITAHGKLVSISVLARAEAGRSAEQILDEVDADLSERLGEWLWGRDDQTQASVVVAALARAGQTIALAESCTGGGLGAALTSVPGASEVLRYGWVCYANEAKTRELGVPAEWMDGPDAPGAVSEEVARAMAEGARARAEADWGLSVTGIAGPGGGSETKPVGTVYLGLASREGSRAILRQQWTRAGRSGVQMGSVRDALELLRRELLSLPPLPERRA